MVAYIRQPSKHYLSAVQQRVRASSRFPAPAAASIRKTLETCESLFGRKPTVMAYERALLLEGDITRDFLGRLLPELAPVIPQMASPTLNESLSAESMAILQDYREANHPDADNLFTTDSVRLRRLLQQTERRRGLYSRPALVAEVDHYIDHASVDLLWLEENHGIRFQEIDYSAIKNSPDHPCQSFSKVSDVCVVDANRQQRILMLATHALLPRQRFALSHLHKIWAHKNHVAGRILLWVRAAVRRWRGAFAHYR